MDLRQLRRRGILTMAINNAWLLHRPHLWTAADPGGRFADIGWKDPAVMKLVPDTRRRDQLRVQTAPGDFRASVYRVHHMPNVWTFPRHARFDHRTFLDGPAVCWGHEQESADSLGIKGVRSSMLQALHLLHALGVRTVYLIGADFNMTAERPYAFAERKDPQGVRGNNAAYAALAKRFDALRPHFADRGFRVINCTAGGNLNSFERLPYAEAVREAARDCARPVNAAGWYETAEAPKGAA